MIQGFDCATPLAYDLARRFRTGGHEFVCRYLVPSGWKALTAAEAQAITAAGLQIISVFETTADRALGGYTAGVNDGRSAAAVAAAVGQPEGSCIYAAVDVDVVNSAQMAAVLEYIRGFSEATPVYNTGVYGSYAVIKAAQAAGVCSRFWQTYAWSGGKRAEGINLYQYRNDVTVNGIGVDFNNAFGNEGAWQVVKEEEEYMMKPEDANKVIGYLKASYEIAPNMEAKEECRRLANELRKVSGQAEE